MSSGDITPELVAQKNKQRAALRREYLKQLTNPHSQEPNVFDPALQRFMSMQATRIQFFKETPKAVMKGLIFLVLPLGLTTYFIKRERDAREAAFRSGQVAYKDRLFKFV